MCIHLRDGSTVWAERSFRAVRHADDRRRKASRPWTSDGDLVIAEATHTGYQELARANVLSGRCWAMPVLANGRIYAKTNKGETVCLDIRADRK